MPQSKFRNVEVAHGRRDGEEVEHDKIDDMNTIPFFPMFQCVNHSVSSSSAVITCCQTDMCVGGPVSARMDAYLQIVCHRLSPFVCRAL